MGEAPVPDETTICKFRNLLEEHNLGPAILKEVNQYLTSRKIKVNNGTIVDATIIHAPSSTKNDSGERDVCAPDGTVTVTFVLVKLLAAWALPANVMESGGIKLYPLITTVLPTAPLDGEIEHTTGALVDDAVHEGAGVIVGVGLAVGTGVAVGRGVAKVSSQHIAGAPST